MGSLGETGMMQHVRNTGQEAGIQERNELTRMLDVEN